VTGEGDRERVCGAVSIHGLEKLLPRPTTAFRRRAWLQFQRALDPLAKPKPLRIERH
jgi:hypothetical protein